MKTALNCTRIPALAVVTVIIILSPLASAQTLQELAVQITSLRTELQERANDQKLLEQNLSEQVKRLDAEVASLRAKVPPVGTVVAYWGMKPPPGWLACDGAAVPSGDAYKELRGLVGERVPDLKGRVIIGVGAGDGLSVRKLGEMVGRESESLQLRNVPPHRHEVMGSWHPDGARGGGGVITEKKSTSLSGGGGFGSFWEYDGSYTTTDPREPAAPFNIMQPSTVMLYIIKY